MFINAGSRRVAPALMLLVLAASEAWAQFDFIGSWAPIGTEDVQNDSVPVDYLGLALTEEGRARALSYNGVAKINVRTAVRRLGSRLHGARAFWPSRVDRDRPGNEARRFVHHRGVGRLERNGHLDG